MAQTITRKIELVIVGKNLATPTLKGFASTLKDIGKIAAGVLGAMGIQSLARGAGKAIQGLGKRAADVMDVGVAFENLAHSINVSSKQWLADLREASRGTISDLELMKTANQAVLLTGKFMARDLPQYLKIAQVAARASGQDVKFLFNSLIRGVARGSPLIIDNALITLDAASAYEAYAAKIGKSVKSLTRLDQQIATHEATLRMGQRMMEKVGDAGATLSMQFQQLRARGENWANAIAMKMAPALSVLMDQLLKTADAAEKGGRAFLSKWGAKLNEAAENALRWGVNIVTQLATGMVQGASQALIWAMNTIGNLLASWLGPGSPPKIVPNLDKWGMAAMQEYIKGMASADLGALSDIQGPLKSALSALVAMGEIGQEQMGEMFAGLSIDIAALIDDFTRTGRIGGDVLNKLAKLGGKFGGHLVEMVRGQLDLLAATKALKSAQDRLNTARQKEDDASDAVKALRQEYFELRRAGASDEILKAKFAEIKAAQTNLRASRKETEAAEKAEEQARRKLDPLEEQVDIQRQILEQLAQMAQMQTKPALAGGKAPGALGGLGAIELPTPDMEPFIGNLQAAFDEAKKRIQETLKDIFAPLVEAWETKMKPAIDAMILKWGEFKGILSDFWNSDFVVGIREWIADLFPEGTLERMGRWIGTGLLLAAAFKILAVAAGLLASPLVLLGLSIAVLAGLWQGHSDQIATTTMQLWAIVFYYLLQISNWLTSRGAVWAAGWEAFKLSVGTAWDGVQVKSEEVWGVLEGIWASANTWLTVTLPGALDTIKGKFETAWEGIKTAVSGPWEFLEGVFQGIKDFGQWLKDHVFNFKINLPKLPDWAIPGSPIPLHEAWKDFATDMKALDFTFPATPTRGLGTGAFGGGMQSAFAGTGGTNITIIVQGDVLDDRTAGKIADQIARVQRLRGIRRY